MAVERETLERLKDLITRIAAIPGGTDLEFRNNIEAFKQVPENAGVFVEYNVLLSQLTAGAHERELDMQQLEELQAFMRTLDVPGVNGMTRYIICAVNINVDRAQKHRALAVEARRPRL